MARANIAERDAERLLGKVVHRIGAEEREGMRLAQIVPEIFQMNRARMIASIAEERDHASKDSHAPTPFCRARDDAPDDLAEAFRLGVSINRKLRQSLTSTQRDILPARTCRRHIQTIILQSLI